MPGHTIGEVLLAQTLKSITEIEKLVQQHDVVFLLTDSRESRWLPTLLGAFHGKVNSNELNFKLNKEVSKNVCL